MTDALTLRPIGYLRSVYQEKFGIPRQSGLVPQATATLTLRDDIGAESLRGIEGFSHLWLIFQFHEVAEEETRLLVRPPRLGGNEKIGVYATRSPFRPNRLGLSLVELTKINTDDARSTLHLSGVDLLDGTPILDIKPYLPFLESPMHARGGFAENPPPRLEVIVTPEVEPFFLSLSEDNQQLIRQTLAQDPRPAYHHDPDRFYHCLLAGHQIHWRCNGKAIYISAIEPN